MIRGFGSLASCGRACVALSGRAVLCTTIESRESRNFRCLGPHPPRQGARSWGMVREKPPPSYDWVGDPRLTKVPLLAMAKFLMRHNITHDELAVASSHFAMARLAATAWVPRQGDDSLCTGMGAHRSPEVKPQIILPAKLQEHLDHCAARGEPHCASPRPDCKTLRFVLDLPLPVPVDMRSWRCDTCRNQRAGNTRSYPGPPAARQPGPVRRDHPGAGRSRSHGGHGFFR